MVYEQMTIKTLAVCKDDLTCVYRILKQRSEDPAGTRTPLLGCSHSFPLTPSQLK